MRVSVIGAAKTTWWRNFWSCDPELYSELRNLQLALARYNCRYVNEMWPGTPYIEFDTEQDYVMFMLRWA